MPALASFVAFAEAPVLAHHAGVQGPPHPPSCRNSTRTDFTRYINDQTHLRSSQKDTEQSLTLNYETTQRHLVVRASQYVANVSGCRTPDVAHF